MAKAPPHPLSLLFSPLLSPLLSLGALLLGALLGLYAAGPALGAGPVREVAVRARPLPLNPRDPGAGRVGRLGFLGALELRSDDRRFGGLSGMLFDDRCQRLLAVADSGSWIVLEPVEEDGRLVDVRRGWIAPILDMAGAPPASKAAADAEEVARTANGDVFVSYEQRHRLERFRGLSPCDPETLARPPVARHVLAETGSWPANGGAEAVAALGDGLLLLSEAAADGEGRRQGLHWSPEAPVGRFSRPVPKGYQPTAMDLFDDGDGRSHLLVLHRHASLLGGLSAVVDETVFAGDPAEAPEGRVVARLGPPLTVDNMEALAVRRQAGRVFLYLASDDNFNPLQRTVLLKFELLPEGS